MGGIDILAHVVGGSATPGGVFVGAAARWCTSLHSVGPVTAWGHDCVCQREGRA